MNYEVSDVRTPTVCGGPKAWPLEIILARSEWGLQLKVPFAQGSGGSLGIVVRVATASTMQEVFEWVGEEMTAQLANWTAIVPVGYPLDEYVLVNSLNGERYHYHDTRILRDSGILDGDTLIVLHDRTVGA